MLRLTTLSENSGMSAGIELNVYGSILGEWGLSILVETEDVKVLLDTGKSVTAVHNAQVLGVDLTKVDKIVLSHCHQDHTGGLREVLMQMKKESIEVIAHPEVWADRYNRREGRKERYVGIPYVRQELENYGAVFNFTRDPVRLAQNVMTSGEVPMVTDFEKVSEGSDNRYRKEGDKEIPDTIADDQALFITLPEGLVVVTGCAHRGIVNTVYHAQKLTGEKRVYGVFGGSHLVASSGERIAKTIEALKDLGVQKLGLCHCTSMPAMAVMAHAFDKRFIFNNAGKVIDLP
jgi:7,8-dihydropterin-6-yl-methyl-4-(beta-D-ribofuranosyl)aminobenzene 5'-phosphate synthase